MNFNDLKNPKMQWRGKPFWSWNGKLDKDELFHQIDVMKEMGFGGYFMHSRTGLETEYLGEEWFDLINACADYGESLGMESWLYDEDRWPSGLAGGLVTKHPEFRQKAILLEIDPLTEAKDVLAEFTCDVEGSTYTKLGAGKNHLRFSIVEQGKSGFYNGFTYVDTMNRDATEAYLQSTHEKYAEKCGDRLGKSIKGIFTDEPHRGAVLDGFSMYREDGASTVPYTQKLFEEFEKRFGYDLIPKLPELFLQLNGEAVSPVKWHFIELLQQLFIENFAIPCQQWCTKNKLILTGHILHEDNLTSQTAMSGSMMRYYEHMDLPGIDVLGEHNKNYWVVKQLASTARQTGKTQMLTETYGCTGWQMPFAGHKAVGDWQALLGINLRCHHLSWYTMRGEAKRDYPASILHQSAWYKEYKHVEDYFARFGMLMAEGEAVCDVLVINPVESVWAQVHLGWSDCLALQDKKIQKVEDDYQKLFTDLLENQIDFDYGDEEMLSRLASVEGDLFRVGKSTYRSIVVAGMVTMRSSTVQLLKAFEQAGGQVIVAGQAPQYIDALKADFPSFKTIDFDKEALLAALPKAIALVEAEDIFGQVRKTDKGLVFAALNVNRDERRENVLVNIAAAGHVCELDLQSGEILAVTSEYANGVTSFTCDFSKAGEKVFFISPEPLIEARAEAPPEALEERPLSGNFEYRLGEDNICVLDFARFRMNQGEWQNAQEVLKIDQAIRDQYQIMRRGGEMLQPWFVKQQELKELCELELSYEFELTYAARKVDLVLEEVDKFQVFVNGVALDTSHTERWIDIAFQRLKIPHDLLRQGQNTISLKTIYSEMSNVEAIYLVGDFGVALKGIQRQLIPLVDKVKIGDLCEQGFPFYSGSFSYLVPVPAGSEKLRLPQIAGACAKVKGQVLGWDPFIAELDGKEELLEVEVILTRRNTFGPLHDAVEGRYWVGPQHFTTEGDEWSDPCIFVASGLLAAPVIYLNQKQETKIYEKNTQLSTAAL
ncbi:glycosyl hydrolase [Lentisphaera profundi]|uniref:Glycosyl hydrolase n=1 Tax=Lentisphaera profundi TaxID=1658616 RepID=A0ABY7VSJ9_9BACT|nr:glycosyl hydrolase [Lentisphaera profundi]WDE97173.1 glycosyl hydrolase [Lentisphaera profundi]